MKTQPSSLPLAERLRFFSSLSEASKRNSCSFTRSPPFNSIERSSSISSYHYYMAATPRSSTSLSSASVTPTPMENPLPHFTETPALLRKNSYASGTNEACADAVECEQDYTDSRFTIKADIVKASPFLQASKQIPSTPLPPVHMPESANTPTTALTPTMKRIKLKTIGKLLLPSTFLINDRNNNNNNNNSSKEGSTSKELSFSHISDHNGENENFGPPKKIGKIKSPFIENCNQTPATPKQVQRSSKFEYNNKTQSSLMALTALENSAEHYALDITPTNNGLSNGGGILNQRKPQNVAALQINGHQQTEDFSTDSGKENVDTSQKEETTPVVEIRRKFTRKANTSQSFNNSTASGVTRQLTPRSASLNGPHSSPQVDIKYAKYFGLTTSSKSAKISLFPTSSKPITSTSILSESFGPQLPAAANPPPCVAALNRNVRLWHSSSAGVKRISSVIQELKKFEEIIVTDRELKLASKEFDNLLLNDSVLKHSSKDVDKIFSSIV